jgi:2-polyprenyl-3-methyl-5-hydroxy-6-metoxy-1,4-benzoquinol methylase
MALSDEQAEHKLAGQNWTAHNIRLSPQVTTMPGKPDFMETDTRLHSILQTLGLFYREGFKDLRVADLACLEGGFALAMAQRGMDVVGIEARQTNLDKALLLQEHFELSNLEFRRDDVKNFTRETYGSFDIVLALGILYHLDEPIKWMGQLASATRGLLIVDSHFAPSLKASLKLLDKRFPLGRIEQLKDGGTTYEGRWFEDCSDAMDREAQVWCSYSNNRSFWLTKESLCCGLMRAGFDLVFEQHPLGDPETLKFFSTNRARGMFVAVKTGAFSSREPE